MNIKDFYVVFSKIIDCVAGYIFFIKNNISYFLVFGDGFILRAQIIYPTQNQLYIIVIKGIT